MKIIRCPLMHTYFQTCITTSILIYLYELYTGFFAFQSFHLVSQRPNTQYNLKSLFHVFIVVFFKYLNFVIILRVLITAQKKLHANMLVLLKSSTVYDPKILSIV